MSQFEGNERWVTAKEVAGLPEMPTTSRRARDILDKATADKPHLRRRKQGTKATEYHISALPEPAIKALLSDMPRLEPMPGATGHDEEADEECRCKEFLEEFALIPGYRVQVSAGFGSINDEAGSPCRHLAFRRKWLTYRGLNERHLVVVWAKGDSMEPTIANNNTLLINTADTKPNDGNMYVIRQDDLLWVKRVQIQPTGSWVLISDNSTYPPMVIPKDDLHNFEVLGRVVHIAKDV